MSAAEGWSSQGDTALVPVEANHFWKNPRRSRVSAPWPQPMSRRSPTIRGN